MSSAKRQAYVGSYGVFLDTVNQPESPLKPMVIDVLKKHGGQMNMKELIMSVHAPVGEVMGTVDVLKSQHVLRVLRSDDDEIVGFI